MILIIKANILLIGCGPHAQRVYLPILKEKEKDHDTKLKAVVDIKGKEQQITTFVKDLFNNVDFLFVEEFGEKYKHKLPFNVEQKLNRIIKEKNINGVIISTDPLNHMQYALWAEKQHLHILMDKPISTYENISNSIEQTKLIKKDYALLIKNYSTDRIFIINAQRRFLPQFDIIQNKVNEIAEKYGMPVTSMQSTHCDGQWRLPNEILTLKYHPLLGWGTISHSGYHFIDMFSKIVKDSFKAANKKFDEISVFSKFIRPSGLLIQQSQKDLIRFFGKEYLKIDSRSDGELLKLYKVNNEAELDATILINLSYKNIPINNVTLNLTHNGFSRRSWMLPNTKDLYKGNGRLRHEYHNIQQGCLQNIQIHSYQSNDKQDNENTEDEYNIGGHNHYDIYIFRNSGITGGKPLEIITAKDIAVKYSLDQSKLINELARHEALKQFIEVIIGKRSIINTKSNITDHMLPVELMSLIYESGIKNIEIKESYNMYKNYNDKGENDILS